MHFALLIVALLSVSFNSYGYEDTQIFEAISIVDTNITKLGGIVDGQTTAINEHATRIEKLQSNSAADRAAVELLLRASIEDKAAIKELRALVEKLRTK